MGASKPVREGSASPKPVMEGGGSVNTHTGSVSVAGSQSNIVKAGTDPVESQDSLKIKPKPRGESVQQDKNSGLGYPPAWWRGPGWKSSQASKPGRGPDLDKSSSSMACGSPEDKTSLQATPDAGLVAENSLTNDVPGDNASLGVISKASLGGRGCVNTQTGSVSVAGSQSNTIYDVCSENSENVKLKMKMSGMKNGLDVPNDVKSKACMSVAQLAKKYSKSEVCTCEQRVNCVCRLEARRPVIGQRKSSKNSHWTRKPSLQTNISSP